MKTIQGISRNQMQFTSLEDFIAAENPVRILDAFVEKLDLVKLGIPLQQPKSNVNPGGAPRFEDKLLLKLYLYGYLNKIRSSRPALSGRTGMLSQCGAALADAGTGSQLSYDS